MCSTGHFTFFKIKNVRRHVTGYFSLQRRSLFALMCRARRNDLVHFNICQRNRCVVICL